MQEIQKTWIQPLTQEESLEEEMATHSSNLAWKISWTEEPSRLQSKGLQRDTAERISTPHTEDKEKADLEEIFVTHDPLQAKAGSFPFLICTGLCYTQQFSLHLTS